ncbi:CACTA en-spm transposon protein [Cucumis melo var. makuwa]|uniref:CACTA en-spm transposon protein n=1 Tax=Cucumis melo var. makuwa TaxID=1194695 RepID=A0A5A7VFB2_CUCMM|nr:CACTA en-spm transposon protein [Cucumis melo var. makuwa]TYK00877.1 CACTA en-spm transposon protein [Cucumis melo var. makuwa]
MHETEDFSQDFFSLIMRPSLEEVVILATHVHQVFYLKDPKNDASKPTPTPRRLQHSHNLELERYVQQNGKILTSIALEGNKPISPRVVRFSCAISVLMRNTFPIKSLKWADVPPEYMAAYRKDNHRYFKKFSDPEEADENPLPRLVNHEQSRVNKAAKPKQPYNNRNESKSFLQRQHNLTEERGYPVDRVELFREAHASRTSEFISQAAVDTIKCWNFSLSPPERVLNHSLQMRYMRPFWASLENTNSLIEKQRRREEERDRQMEKQDQQMEGTAQKLKKICRVGIYLFPTHGGDVGVLYCRHWSHIDMNCIGDKAILTSSLERVAKGFPNVVLPTFLSTEFLTSE